MSQAESVVSSCLSCARGWLHCHETWVVHPDGSAECTKVDCTVGPEGHDLVVGCREIDAGCCA